MYEFKTNVYNHDDNPWNEKATLVLTIMTQWWQTEGENDLMEKSKKKKTCQYCFLIETTEFERNACFCHDKFVVSIVDWWASSPWWWWLFKIIVWAQHSIYIPTIKVTISYSIFFCLLFDLHTSFVVIAFNGGDGGKHAKKNKISETFRFFLVLSRWFAFFLLFSNSHTHTHWQENEVHRREINRSVTLRDRIHVYALHKQNNLRWIHTQLNMLTLRLLNAHLVWCNKMHV